MGEKRSFDFSKKECEMLSVILWEMEEHVEVVEEERETLNNLKAMFTWRKVKSMFEEDN